MAWTSRKSLTTIRGSSGRIPHTDPSTHALFIVTESQHAAHEGKGFNLYASSSDLDTASTLVLGFKTSDSSKYVHAAPMFEVSGKALCELYEGSTLSDDGTNATPRCTNRVLQSSSSIINTSDTLNSYSRDPTVNTAGTRLWMSYLGASEKFSISGADSGPNALMLNSDTVYMARITALADNVVGSIIVSVHEHTDLS